MGNKLNKKVEKIAEQWMLEDRESFNIDEAIDLASRFFKPLLN